MSLRIRVVEKSPSFCLYFSQIESVLVKRTGILLRPSRLCYRDRRSRCPCSEYLAIMEK